MATPAKTGRERQEESSNAGGKPGLRKPVFTKVDQLKPGTGGHTLTVEVLNSIAVLPKGRSVSHHLRQSRIADTGSIIFTPKKRSRGGALHIIGYCLYALWFFFSVNKSYLMELVLQFMVIGIKMKY
ncbi:hypothetical protein OIU78_017850 [Salix suchowensis]|nr:hypothetical protein OIU78_017850 [Salix suchowensis]